MHAVAATRGDCLAIHTVTVVVKGQLSLFHQGLPYFSISDRIPGKFDPTGYLGLVCRSGIILGERVLQANLQIIMGFLFRNVPVGAGMMAL